MKRVFNLFFALALCFSFVACTDDENDDYIIDVIKSEDSMRINVSVPYVEGMSYVNIFRKDDFKDIFNLGQIIPASKNINATYIFEDNLVFDGREYQYMARFKINDSYKTTGWSDAIKVSQKSPVFTDDPKPVLSSEECYFSYDAETATLALVPAEGNADASISLPTEGDFSKYNLGLAVSTKDGEYSTIFKLAAGSSYTSKSSPVLLRMILTQNYFNKEIVVKGIVCQLVSKKYQKPDEEDSTLRYTTVQWTAPREIRVKSDGKDISYFTVSQTASNDGNYDFSDIAVTGSRGAKINAETDSAQFLDYSD